MWHGQYLCVARSSIGAYGLLKSIGPSVTMTGDLGASPVYRIATYKCSTSGRTVWCISKQQNGVSYSTSTLEERGFTLDLSAN